MMEHADGTDDRYRRKIKTRTQLREIIGTRPRAKKVIMCHGTFDLVHPGHLRHLMYARTKADVLVASLTTDAFISKASYRPFVPQQLRAMNLAALEVVDFVIIDDQPTPLENLSYLQPDYFAKGYEYISGGVHPNTQREIDVLNSYGGEIILTPGDIVFSSSRFIETTPPNLASEKLHTLMESESVTFDDLRRTLDRCHGRRVHVLGDTIVDSYIYSTPIGSSTSKTPTLSVKFEEQVDFAGGAAVVSHHLRAAGADVTFSTLLGDDAYKDFVLSEMDKHGIRCLPVIDPTRPTTNKTAHIANGYRLLKVDRVDNRPISEKILDQFKAALSSSADVDAYVFSDFRHGIFGKATIPELTAALKPGPLRVADSQVASRWGNILDFHGFDLITPNEKEARFALGDQDSVVRPMAFELYSRAACKLLVLKMGERGMMVYRAPSHDSRAFFQIDPFAGRVVDAMGAGDALLAYATVSLSATGNSVIASILASMAAAVACEHEGNTPVQPEQVLEKIRTVEECLQFA